VGVQNPLLYTVTDPDSSTTNCQESPSINSSRPVLELPRRRLSTSYSHGSTGPIQSGSTANTFIYNMDLRCGSYTRRPRGLWHVGTATTTSFCTRLNLCSSLARVQSARSISLPQMRLRTFNDNSQSTESCGSTPTMQRQTQRMHCHRDRLFPRRFGRERRLDKFEFGTPVSGDTGKDR